MFGNIFHGRGGSAISRDRIAGVVSDLAFKEIPVIHLEKSQTQESYIVGLKPGGETPVIFQTCRAEVGSGGPARAVLTDIDCDEVYRRYQSLDRRIASGEARLWMALGQSSDVLIWLPNGKRQMLWPTDRVMRALGERYFD